MQEEPRKTAHDLLPNGLMQMDGRAVFRRDTNTKLAKSYKEQDIVESHDCQISLRDTAHRKCVHHWLIIKACSSYRIMQDHVLLE